jgi:hypothetical protein
VQESHVAQAAAALAAESADDPALSRPYPFDVLGAQTRGAACRFAAATGGLAGIGCLGDATDLLAGRAGTIVRTGQP